MKPATEESVAGGVCPTNRRPCGNDAGEETRLLGLNKNATELGAPVAEKSQVKDWLNCCAETRPWNYREQLPILI